jgi:hypothetical protein
MERMGEVEGIIVIFNIKWLFFHKSVLYKNNKKGLTKNGSP